jgi:hypothetical protein
MFIVVPYVTSREKPCEATMSSTDIAVFGLYPSVIGSEQGAADLISAGFPCPDISVLLADWRSERDLASLDKSGATAGGLRAGGLLSGALGILNGSARVIGGVVPIVAAGPIAARWASLGCAAAQGLSGALVNWGIPVFEAKSFEGRIQDGGTLLAVRCETPARAKRAQQVLNSSGADDVAALEESRTQKAEWALI